MQNFILTILSLAGFNSKENTENIVGSPAEI